MKNVLIKFNKTHFDAVLPLTNNATQETGDTGYDLTAVDEAVIPAGHSKVIPVGLKLAYITPGFWFRIEPRSGLGFKHSIQPHLGVIDNGYKGDLGVKLYNFHHCNPAIIRPGDRIAQLVVYELIQPHMVFTDNSYESERGESGFGSSG